MRPSTPPPSYSRRMSNADFVAVVARFGGGLIAVIAFIIYALGTAVASGKTIPMTLLETLAVALLLAALVVGWFILRAWYAYTHNIVQVDNRTALMTVRRKGPLLLGLAYSADDAYPLADMKIATPDRKWWQRSFMFDCDDIILRAASGGREPVTLRNVKDVDRILAIQKYVTSLPSEQTRYAEENNELLRETVRLLQDQNQMLAARPAQAQSQPSPSSVPTPIRFVRGPDGVYYPENE